MIKFLKFFYLPSVATRWRMWAPDDPIIRAALRWRKPLLELRWAKPRAN